jgi:hypothetical protein
VQGLFAAFVDVEAARWPRQVSHRKACCGSRIARRSTQEAHGDAAPGSERADAAPLVPNELMHVEIPFLPAAARIARGCRQRQLHAAHGSARHLADRARRNKPLHANDLQYLLGTTPAGEALPELMSRNRRDCVRVDLDLDGAVDSSATLVVIVDPDDKGGPHVHDAVSDYVGLRQSQRSMPRQCAPANVRAPRHRRNRSLFAVAVATRRRRAASRPLCFAACAHACTHSLAAPRGLHEHRFICSCR